MCKQKERIGNTSASHSQQPYFRVSAINLPLTFTSKSHLLSTEPPSQMASEAFWSKTRRLVSWTVVLVMFLISILIFHLHFSRSSNVWCPWSPFRSVEVPFQVFDATSYPTRESYAVEESPLTPNQTCRIPPIFPYEDQAMRLIQNRVTQEKLSIPHCVSHPTAKFTTDGQTTLLRVDDVADFWNENTCCYSPFTRSNSTLHFAECVPMTHAQTTIPSQVENIQVECANSGGSLSHRDFFHFFRLNSTLQVAMAATERHIPQTPQEQWSVLLLVIEGVSLANFQRLLPKTRDFLMKQLGALEFHGLNKMGIGSPVNLLPLLSGCDSANHPPPNSQQCPFLWDSFSSEGYRTVFSVDSLWMQNELGLVNETESLAYNNFAFVQGLRNFLSSSRTEDSVGCFEHQFGPQVLFERGIQVARQLSTQPYFHLLTTGTLTHRVIAMAKFLDDPLLHFLEALVHEGLLATTVLVLTSDQGNIDEDYARTFQGNVEANAPLLYLSFPEAFQGKYSQALENIRSNTHTLLTHHDIHDTLKDLLNPPSISDEALRSQSGQSPEVNGPSQSLFLPIPLNRTCVEARVPQFLCLCSPWEDVSKTEATVIAAARFALQHLNQELQANPQCVPFEFYAVLHAKKSKDDSGVNFMLSISTKPLRVEIRASVRLSGVDGQCSFEMLNGIQNLPRKKDERICGKRESVANERLRNLCYCKV